MTANVVEDNDGADRARCARPWKENSFGTWNHTQPHSRPASRAASMYLAWQTLCQAASGCPSPYLSTGTPLCLSLLPDFSALEFQKLSMQGVCAASMNLGTCFARPGGASAVPRAKDVWRQTSPAPPSSRPRFSSRKRSRSALPCPYLSKSLWPAEEVKHRCSTKDARKSKIVADYTRR